MRKIAAIIALALIISSCTGSRGCGCPNWGMAPDHKPAKTAPEQVANLNGIAQQFIWQ
jgi:PBP1b-binding outer membrane lipoprotein LpoB